MFAVFIILVTIVINYFSKDDHEYLESTFLAARDLPSLNNWCDVPSYEPGVPSAFEACGEPRAPGPTCGAFGWGRMGERTVRQRGAPAEPWAVAYAALRLLVAHLLLVLRPDPRRGHLPGPSVPAA